MQGEISAETMEGSYHRLLRDQTRRDLSFGIRGERRGQNLPRGDTIYVPHDTPLGAGLVEEALREVARALKRRLVGESDDRCRLLIDGSDPRVLSRDGGIEDGGVRGDVQPVVAGRARLDL